MLLMAIEIKNKRGQNVFLWKICPVFGKIPKARLFLTVYGSKIEYLQKKKVEKIYFHTQELYFFEKKIFFLENFFRKWKKKNINFLWTEKLFEILKKNLLKKYFQKKHFFWKKRKIQKNKVFVYQGKKLSVCSTIRLWKWCSGVLPYRYNRSADFPLPR